MRALLPLLLILAGCTGNAGGKWPSLATRPGEVARDPGSRVLACTGCGMDEAAAPAPVPAPAPPSLPLPADVESRLAETSRTITEIEASAPVQAKAAAAAIAAARRNPGLSGDAEVERSRFEALFLPLSVEVRRLEGLADDVAGRDGADAVLTQIEALRRRIEALEQTRVSLPN